MSNVPLNIYQRYTNVDFFNMQKFPQDNPENNRLLKLDSNR